jgi:hypothetical protein
MTTLTISLPRPHVAQRQVIAEARRFNVVNCGRRWGKSTLGIDRAIGPMMDAQPVGWFSPTYKMLSDVWRIAKRILKPITRHVSEQDKRIELITGGVIEFWSLDTPDVARGRKYARIIIDEAAMIRHLEEAWNEVIRPTLTDLEGDGWFLSTPKGRNYYHTLYQRGQQPDGEWMSWSMPTSSNPYINADEIESAKNELPERSFMQEYLAVFIEDGSGVFRRVLEAATATPQESAIAGHQYVFGVDWGKSQDWTVISVIDTTLREQVYQDRFNQIDYQVQLGRLMSVRDRFNPTVIVPESNSIGVPLIEQLQRAGVHLQPFQTTNASKAVAIDALSLAFERQDLAILNDPILIGELQAYEAERLPSGMLRYNAPPGQHDDTVMALALAWQAASVPPPASVAIDTDHRSVYAPSRGGNPWQR